MNSEIPRNTVLLGDCRILMREMPENCVDAIVTDPPYGLEFMGKAWDRLGWRDGGGFSKPGIGERETPWVSYGGETANPTCSTCGGRMRGAKKCTCESPDWRVKGEPFADRRVIRAIAMYEWHLKWAIEALRIAKPGAHMLAFGGTRTHHRLMCAIEDAGWEIRDCRMFLYGSGFPKSLDVSKAIDKAAGAEREVVTKVRVRGGGTEHINRANVGQGYRPEDYQKGENILDITSPITDAAKQWAGWGTALKPAWEIVILAQKPLSPDKEHDLIVRNLLQIELRLWSLLPANVAEKSFGLNQKEYAAVCDSAQWGVEEKHNIQVVLLDRMDTWQFAVVMTSCLNTVSSWRHILADHLNEASTSTTKTGTKPIIDLKTLSSCVSVLTPLSIIQDAITTHGLWLNASPAVSYLNAACHNINSTRILSALDPAILRELASPQGGTGRAFSPNWEPVILARKPLEGTVAENVQKWGTGALNIDECRIAMQEDDAAKSKNNWKPQGYVLKESIYDLGTKVVATQQSEMGRWPANLLLDEMSAAMLDEQSGTLKSGMMKVGQRRSATLGKGGYHGHMPDEATAVGTYGDSGGASRFFFTAKASSAERNKYLTKRNPHPTVKPIALMRYLCRLVTPPGGLILDPFCGSGSTGVAAFEEGFDFILIDNDSESCETAKLRCAQKRLGERSDQA